MPLKLVPPRQGKSPNFTVRGTYLGVTVDRTTGTHRRGLARQQLRAIERSIERSEYNAKPAPAGPTFLSAALTYLKLRRPAKKYARAVGRLAAHFGETPIADIDQQAIDAAALALYPNVTAATRNGYVYTPVSAVLHAAGDERKIKRPPGAKGRVVTDHLNPPDAFPIIAAAYEIKYAFGLFLKFLLYTGCRISEVLAIRRREDLRLSECRAWIPTSKNEDPREVVLRDDLAAELAAYVGDELNGRLFPFHQGGHLKHLLMRAKLKVLGLPCPARRPTGWRAPPNRLAWVNFHTFCHTWATWMRRYGGLDLQGLVATGRWRDARSAARYAHVEARAEWDRVERLPGAGGKSVEKARDAG